MDALLAMLLLWIDANTTYSTNGIPAPQVIELSAEELTAEYYQDNPSGISDTRVDPRIRALYSWEDGENGTIYVLESNLVDVSLTQEVGLENPWFQELLLHELIHHVQYLTGEYEKYTCRNEGELPAYFYSGLFLRQQQVHDPLPNRRLLAHVYSRC